MIDEQMQQIYEALQESDFERARELLKVALQNPTPEIYYCAAQAALNKQQKKSFLEKALALDPFYTPAAESLGKFREEPQEINKNSNHSETETTSKRTPFFLIIGTLLIITSIYFVFQNSEKQNTPIENSPQMTISPTPSPSPVPVPTSSPTPVFGIGSTKISEKDGMVQVYIPAGEFLMGNTNTAWWGDQDENPQHSVYLDAFWIDQTEITNEMYARCVTTGTCVKPSMSGSRNRSSYYGQSEFDDYPVVNVDWNDAKTYCEWAGRRLPSEPEWEKAARGGLEGKLYPWGDEEPICIKGAVNGAKFDDDASCDDTDTEKVGSYTSNGYDIFDMAGNVEEWTADWFDAYPGWSDEFPGGDRNADEDFGEKYRVVRGGSWRYNDYMRAADRGRATPNLYNYDLGFRCAQSP